MPKDVYGEVEITYDMLAARNKRFVNYVIDTLITYVTALFVFYFSFRLYENTNIKTPEDWAVILNSFDFMLYDYIAIIMYYGLLESLVMRSSGKYVTDTMVIMRDGSKPTSTAILIRTLCRIIPFEFVSFFGRLPVGLHDVLSKTVVVDVFKYNQALKRKNKFQTRSSEL